MFGIFVSALGNGWNLLASSSELYIYGKECSKEGTSEQVILYIIKLIQK